MQKSYSRINWENYPSENTPINESNLNRIDYATNEIDDRVISLDTTKANVASISGLVSSIAINETTGEITITKYNGSTTVLQTTLNKIAINFTYDYASQALVLTLNDGTTTSISLASLIQNNEFDDTATVDFTVSDDGHVSAIVPEGSITDAHLRADYLADIRVSESNAAASATSANASDLNSEAWAVGERDGSPVVSGDETYRNNSKYYSQLTQSLKEAVETIREDAEDLLETATNRLTGLNLMVNYSDGCLYYDINSGVMFSIDATTGQLQYEITT